MIDCYIRVNKGGKLYNDCIGAWLYSFLTSQYHDEGFGEFFNKSKVNGHSFYVDKKEVQDGELLKISIRGIPIIENKFLKGLYVGKHVRIDKVRGEITLIDTHDYEYKSVYQLGTPLIVRKESVRYKHHNEQKTLDELVTQSLERQYRELYGETLPGLATLKLHLDKPQEVRLRIHNEWIYHTAYTGHVEVTATDEWLEFMQQVGLGNRNSYGYGALI